MKFEKYLVELAKIAKTQPDNLFAMSIEDFSKVVEQSAQELNDKRLLNLKAQIEDPYAGVEPGEPVDIELKRKKLQDSYDNAALMIGQSDAFSSFDTYDVGGLLYNWHLWTSFYITSWVFARAIDRPSTDMVRPGWKVNPKFKDEKIKIEQGDNKLYFSNKKFDFDEFYKKQRTYIPQLIQAVKWSKLYGGSIACLLTKEDDPTVYETELEPTELNKHFKLLVVDRYQGCVPSREMVTDVESDDYNTPKFYSVVTENGSYRFHHSRVLRFANGEAPYMIKNMLMGWGIPDGVRLFNEINRDERIKNMITSALAKHSLEIIKMSGMKQYMTGQLSPQMEAELDEKLALINRFRHFNSLIFLDKDDEYQRQDGAALGTLASLMETNSRFVAGAVPMPQVLLYGDQQAGLSGNSFDDMLIYEDHIMSLRQDRLEAQARKLSFWIAMSMGYELISCDVIFNSSIPVTKPQKVENTNTYLDIWQKAMDMGLYTKQMIYEEIKANRGDLVIGDAVTDEIIQKVADEETEQLIEGEGESDKNEKPEEPDDFEIPTK